MRKIVFLAFLGDVFTVLYGSCVSDGLLRGLVFGIVFNSGIFWCLVWASCVVCLGVVSWVLLASGILFG